MPELTSYSLIRPDVEWLHRHINIFCVIRPWLPWLCYRPPINVVVKSIRCSKMCFVAEDKPLRAVQYFYWSLTDSSLIVLIRKLTFALILRIFHEFMYSFKQSFIDMQSNAAYFEYPLNGKTTSYAVIKVVL